jgi:uncharacterized protein YbjT (DUF2867 family)
MVDNTIVVCGATGNQGGAVVNSLLAANSVEAVGVGPASAGLRTSQRWNVVALSRDPNGAAASRLRDRGVEVRRADLKDAASLREAFADAYGVFGVTQPWSPDYRRCDARGEVVQGRNIVRACLDSGVQHLVMSTVMTIGREKTGVSHVDSKLEIEEIIRMSGLAYTLLRPGSFMDNIGMPFFPIRKGSVKGWVNGQAKVPYVACKDIGVFAAMAFQDPETYLYREVPLIGDFVSGQELTAILSKMRSGEPFKYKAPSRLLMRIFAKEFYGMRAKFEDEWGKPPYPPEMFAALTSCREVNPSMMTVEDHLRSQGYADKALH